MRAGVVVGFLPSLSPLTHLAEGLEHRRPSTKIVLGMAETIASLLWPRFSHLQSKTFDQFWVTLDSASERRLGGHYKV